MKVCNTFCSALLAVFMMVLTVFPAAAQQAATQFERGHTKFTISAFPLYQFDTELESGGDYNVQRYFFRFDANRQITDNINAGLGFVYDYEDWDFTGATGFQGIPWGTIHRAGIDFTLRYRGSKDWSISFTPSIRTAGEDGAEWDDSILSGAALGAIYRFSDDLSLGFGAGVYTGLEETQTYPFLMVRWQITDQLLLANPFRTGPTGPAGLELSYALDDNWEVAAGAAYRSFRFRLDDRVPAPDGIGEVDLVPAWGRLSLKIRTGWAFDLYAGYALDGELTLEDQNGNELGNIEQDPAPFGAIAVSYQFLN
jgi:hypothetical protein